METTSELMSKMPDYLETVTQYRNPGDSHTDVDLFQFGRNTNLKFFEWLKDDPGLRMHFEKVMDNLNAFYRLGEPMGLAGMYPFEHELGCDTVDGEVVLVDVGGGRGQILVDVHKHLPNLKGRLVLEDLPVTFTDFEAPPGIELLPCSFFEPQPIIGMCPTHAVRRLSSTANFP